MSGAMTSQVMQVMTEQIAKDAKASQKMNAPLYAKYRKYFAKKEAREAAAAAAYDGPELEPMFDIRDWSSLPSKMSVAWVGLNPDPMKAKLMKKWADAGMLPMPVEEQEAKPSAEEEWRAAAGALTLPDWASGDGRDGPRARPQSAHRAHSAVSSASGSRRPQSAGVARSMSATSLSRPQSAMKRPMSAQSRSTASGSEVSGSSGYSGTSVTPSDSASQYGTEPQTPMHEPRPITGRTGMTRATENTGMTGMTRVTQTTGVTGTTARSGESYASSYLSEDSVPERAMARPQSASSGSARSLRSATRRPRSAMPATGRSMDRSYNEGEQTLLQQEARQDYMPSPKGGRPGTPTMQRSRSAGSVASSRRAAPKRALTPVFSRKKVKTPSAAINFLTQTLNVEPNPHHALDKMALYGDKWSVPCNEQVPKEDRRKMLAWGYSHEGEGRAGYLRATYQKPPPLRNVLPATNNQMIGFTLPIGQPMKLFPAKQKKPGVRDFLSVTRNTGLRRPELGRMTDDACYPGG